MAAQLAKAAGFRNVLVHEYGKLDRERVRRAVFQDVKDLEEVARAVEAHLRERARR